MEKECFLCGTLLEKSNKYLCEECERKLKILNQVKKVDSAKKKIENAVKKFAHKTVDYSNERDLVIKKILYDNYKFNSEDEVCFALQLEKENVDYLPNFPIGSFKVDFILPKMKKIVEIDGSLYHTDTDKDFIRERAIMSMAGEEYEIVRIPTVYIPGSIIFDLKDMLNFIVEQRYIDRKFRDTRYDKRYITEFLNLRKFQKGARK